MRIIPLMYVTENHRLGRTLFDTDHRLLLRAGTPISKSHRQRLQDGGYYSVYIEENHTQYTPEPIIPDVLRDECLSTIKEAFKGFRTLMELEKETPSPRVRIKLKNQILQRNQQIESIVEISDRIIEDLNKHRYSRIEYVEPKNMYDYAYQHALNMAILTTLIGFRMERNINELRSMFISSILCEMGNLSIPQEILFKRGRLTAGEFEIVKNHCAVSYHQVNSLPELNYMIKTICLEHHEKVDGSGYPNGLKGETMSLMSRIVSVADAYDAMTSDRTYRMAFPPHKALESLKNKSGIHYDADVVHALSEIIQPFPIGTIVSLNSKRFGVVIDANEEEPFRPIIRMLDVESSEELDLKSHRELLITGIKYSV